MKERLKYRPEGIDVVPASTAELGETIEVFIQPNRTRPGKHFSMEVEKVRIRETLHRGIIIFAETHVIGKSKEDRRISIGGGTAIVKTETSSSALQKEKVITHRQRGRVRITTMRF